MLGLPAPYRTPGQYASQIYAHQGHSRALLRMEYCYGPSVISVTVTKGGHPRGGGLYGTSGTMGRGVSRVM